MVAFWLGLFEYLHRATRECVDQRIGNAVKHPGSERADKNTFEIVAQREFE